MTVSVVVGGRCHELEDVEVRQDSSNAWTLRIGIDDRVRKRARRSDRMEDWDEAVFMLDDQQTAPAVATGEGDGWVEVSVWI